MQCAKEEAEGAEHGFETRKVRPEIEEYLPVRGRPWWRDHAILHAMEFDPATYKADYGGNTCSGMKPGRIGGIGGQRDRFGYLAARQAGEQLRNQQSREGRMQENGRVEAA
jgi:hypothetical protein